MKRTLILMISALWCIQGASAAAQTGEAFIEVKVSDRYKYRDDGKPGREVFVDYRGPRQLRSGKLLSRSEFFVISKHFTATPRIPPASAALKKASFNCNFTVEPQTFTADLTSRLRSL